MPEAPAPSLPPDLQELVDVWLAVEREADMLLAALDDEQFNWAPAPGVWSIAQCFDHLNAASAVYLSRMQPAIAAAQAAGYTRRGPIASTWWGRRFVASMGPRAVPSSMKYKAPKLIRPSARRRKAEVWPEFVRLHRQLRTLVAEVGPLVDLNRAIFPNPFIRGIRMRCGTALRVMAAHDRRHLLQAQRVRQAEGFPRS
jgi:hypothetical protein